MSDPSEEIKKELEGKVICKLHRECPSAEEIIESLQAAKAKMDCGARRPHDPRDCEPCPFRKEAKCIDAIEDTDLECQLGREFARSMIADIKKKRTKPSDADLTNQETSKALVESAPLMLLTCINKDEPPIEVKHADLKRSDDSKWRSECPKCKYGFLPVRRDDETFRILSEDMCTLCAQRFIYTDIGKGEY